MPLLNAGKRILANMQSQYGADKGKQVFYASINKGTIPRAKVEGKKK